MGECRRAALAFALGVVATASPSPSSAQASGASPSGPIVVRPDADESLQWAASVVELTPLRRQGLTAKLFGTAGGDPAMNGLYTYLAFFEGSPDEGWTVFQLGDFLSYRVLAEAPGRITLEVRESVMNERSGTIGARTRRLAISWSLGAGGKPPALVRVTPAR